MRDWHQRTRAAYAKVAGLGLVVAFSLSQALAPTIALADNSSDVLDVVVSTDGSEAVLAEATDAQVEQVSKVAVEETPISPEVVLESDAGAVSDTPSSPQEEASDEDETPADGQASPVAEDSTSSPSDAASESIDLETDAGGSAAEGDASVAVAQVLTTKKLLAKASAATASKTTVATTATTTQTKETKAESSTTLKDATNVFRMYNPNSGEHFYTAAESEALYLFGVGWRWEGIAYQASRTTGAAVYRLYNPNAGAHFYTTDGGERDYLASLGWRREGTAWYAWGTSALYRLYNPNSPIGEHLYTASAAERDSVRAAGWSYEGTAWAVTPGYIALSDTTNHMVYSPAYGSTERYWIASDGSLAKGRMVKSSESHVGYDVYATSTGAIARNRHVAVSQTIYATDNDGRLSLATSLNGIDIASYQASMNTASVDADFVIVKATQGTNYTNPYMTSQAEGVLNSGKLLGFYHYASTNHGGGDAVAEADYFISKVRGYVGKAILVLDWEDGSNGNFGSNDVSYVKTFLDRVYNQTGIRGLVYMSKSVTRAHNWSSVANSGYKLWCAQYANMRTQNGYSSNPWTDSYGFGAWSSPTVYQYSATGRISGYSADLDLDLYYGSSDSWKALASKQ